MEKFDWNGYETVINNNTLSNEKKASEIQRLGEDERKQIDKDLNKWKLKHWGGAALEIGSAVIPVGAGGKLAVGLTKQLVPKIGRKIAQETATGLTSGLVGGGVFGLGRGLVEDKNPLLTAVQDSAAGGVTGGIGGAGLGYAGKVYKGGELKDIDKIKPLRKKALQYYDDYLSGTSTNHKDLGAVKFTNTGKKKLKFTSADKRKLISIPKLPQLIKSGTMEGVLPPYKKNAKFSSYYYLTNKKTMNGKPFEHRITIGDDVNGKRFYNINDIKYLPPRL